MGRKFFIGVDEAGYGPNLGPLVVAASLWSAPSEFTETRFSEALQSHFSARTWTSACQHVPLGDSKKLYSTRVGLATLEAGLLACLGTVDDSCRSLGSLIDRVARVAEVKELQALAWYQGYAVGVIPRSLPAEGEVQRLTALASTALANSGLKLVDLQAAVICEPHFNREVAKSGSKGELLSRTTLELVVQLLEQCGTATEVFCDRQGGRKNYLPNLLAAMPNEWFIETAVDSQRSSYQNRSPRSLSIHFSVGGDSFPPTALASMLAKYLRERLMETLNIFWRRQLPDLQPTAGYPVDARRFRAAIESAAEQLDLSLDQWWRCK